jgi:hypothetical protein
MHIFLNSRSFEGQAPTLHAAGQLLDVMMRTIEHLDAIERPRGDRLVTERPPAQRDDLHAYYRDGSFFDVRVTPAATFPQVKDYRLKQLNDEALEQNLYSRFIGFLNCLTRSPLAVEMFPELDLPWQRVDTNDHVAGTALGYAAHFTASPCEATGGGAVVVSADGSPSFAATDILIALDDASDQRLVWNVVQPHHVITRRRWYDHNQKHPPDGDIRDFVAAMDLSSEEAQVALDRAVQLEGERRVFARYKQRIYIFPRHIQRNDEQPESRSLYHGFRVGDPRKMRSSMGDICSKLYKYFRWEELEP